MATKKAQPAHKSGNIITHIIREFKDQNRAEIRKWRTALAMAADITSPRNYLIQDMYENLESDGHLMAQIRLRKAATTGYGFSIVDRKTGKINSEKSELFQSEWFYNLIDNILDSVFKGYTVLELTNPDTMEFTLIPRRNTLGVRQMVLFEAAGYKGIDISHGYEHTLLHVGKKDDIGIMANICGQLIWKRNAQQSWAEFTERFGMPLISATTNKTSQADIDNINRMLNTLGEAATAVLPEGTNIKIDPFTGGDSYRVFDAQIERINDEISKPIIGGTMITDSGSSRSQSEVHERNLDDKIAETDRRMVQFVVNNQLLPIMQYWGWNVNPETDKFLFDSSFELSLTEHWNIVSQVMNRYDVDTEWVSKTFNVPIVGERKQPLPDDKDGGLAENFE